MRYILYYTLSCFLLLFAFPDLYSQSYKGTFRLEQRSLRERVDSVELSLLLHLHARPLQECQAMWITPVLTDGEHSACFPYIEVTGRERSRANRRWQKTQRGGREYDGPRLFVALSASTDTLLRYRVAIPLEKWMEEAQLLLEEEFRECAGDRRLHTYSFDLRVEPWEREPYVVSPRVNTLAIDRQKSALQKQGEAFLDFRVNETVIDPFFGRNAAELDSVRRVMEIIQKYPQVKINSLAITGYASPEGMYMTNEQLARERAIAMRDYLRRHYDLPAHLFRMGHVAEDWGELRRMVDESRMEHRYEVLQIIDRVGIFDGRELLLMKLDGGRPYREMLRDLFPRLRRVEYRIGFSIEETSPASGNSPALYGTSAGNAPEEWDEPLLKLITELFPEDVPARINLAAIYLQRGDLRGAAVLLDPLAEDPRAFNNLGVWYLLNGDADGAEEYFRRAHALGLIEAVHNLEEVRRQREDRERREKYMRRRE